VSARSRIVEVSLRVATAVLLATAVPYDALAHALLGKSEPARRAVLSMPPTQVRLWFSERLEPAFSNASVVDADGKAVTEQQARIAAEDPKLLELPLPGLGPGTYTVRYKVLSVDGHSIDGSFKFSIRGR
jgi:hypothetical protein